MNKKIVHHILFQSGAAEVCECHGADVVWLVWPFYVCVKSMCINKGEVESSEAVVVCSPQLLAEHCTDQLWG